MRRALGIAWWMTMTAACGGSTVEVLDGGTPVDASLLPVDAGADGGESPPDGGASRADAGPTHAVDGGGTPSTDSGAPSSCAATDLGSRLGMRLVSGELAESDGEAAAASCAYGGPTRRTRFTWTPPETGRYSAYAYFYEPTILTVHDGCGGPELGCGVGIGTGDLPGASFDAIAGSTYVIGIQSANPDDGIDEAVDGWDLNIVPYEPETECTFGDDDDFDGLRDCDDPDCALDASCDVPLPPCTRVCASGYTCVNCAGWGELCLPESDPTCGLPPA